MEHPKAILLAPSKPYGVPASERSMAAALDPHGTNAAMCSPSPNGRGTWARAWEDR